MINKKILTAILISSVFLACGTINVSPAQASSKTIKNLIVKSTDDDEHEIEAVKDGHTYTIKVDTATAKIYKSKSGRNTLKFSSIKDGDVLNVKGSVHDRDITAATVRDLSTTTSATFYGVVTERNTATQTVKIATLDRGNLTVSVLKSTKVTYDGKKRAFADIRDEDKVLVTGTWNKSKKTITKTKNFDILAKDDYEELD